MVDKAALNAQVVRLRLTVPDAYAYAFRAGQYLTLWRRPTLGRSYSIASLPAEHYLELHVRSIARGRVSSWVTDELLPGDAVEVSPATGNCFYDPQARGEPLLLLGTGTGLAPLYGIVRDALAQGHRGPIHLLHGAVHTDGLYYRSELVTLASSHPQLRYRAFSLKDGDGDVERRPIDEAALGVSPDFTNWRIYLCGDPEMVTVMRRRLFLTGAPLRQIHADAFVPSPATA